MEIVSGIGVFVMALVSMMAVFKTVFSLRQSHTDDPYLALLRACTEQFELAEPLSNERSSNASPRIAILCFGESAGLRIANAE